MKKLLFSITKDDFIFESFSGTGPGGSNRNKNQNCVRCIHKESGSIGTGQEERSHTQNKKNAFKRCVESQTFKIWMNRKIYEIQQGFTLEENVDKMLQEENLKIETKEDGRWVTLENGQKICY